MREVGVFCLGRAFCSFRFRPSVYFSHHLLLHRHMTPVNTLVDAIALTDHARVLITRASPFRVVHSSPGEMASCCECRQPCRTADVLSVLAGWLLLTGHSFHSIVTTPFFDMVDSRSRLVPRLQKTLAEGKRVIVGVFLLPCDIHSESPFFAALALSPVFINPDDREHSHVCIRAVRLLPFA